MKRACVIALVLVASACMQQAASTPSSPAAHLPQTQSRATNGGIVEYSLPVVTPPKNCFTCSFGGPAGITAGADGNLWFVDPGTDHVGRITPGGTVTWFPVPGTGAGSMSIVAGPDGNVWMVARVPFPEPSQDWILRITPAGAVTEFSAGAVSGGSGTGPTGLTVGPDRNLWFTEIAANRIARMTPEGHLTEFPIPTFDTAPQGIVTGPDGNLWFTESSRSHVAVARITPAGVITEFPIEGAGPDLDPQSIISGPDHNLWFGALGEIDRMTTSGLVTRFAGVGSEGDLELTSGPDGNIWFADVESNSIGRMSVDGKFVTFPLPRPFSKPSGIAVGPDHRIWFTEADARQVGSVGLTVPQLKLTSRVVAFTGHDQVETLSNVGDGSLSVASVSLSGADESAFRVTGDSCSGKVLAAGARCQLRLSFTGTGSGALQAAQISITDNATGSPQVVSLVAGMPACRLPVVLSSLIQGPASGGFLQVPEGQYVADPSAQLPALAYDREAAKWLPVPAAWISPDGKRYVDAAPSRYPSVQITVVDVATGAEHALGQPGIYVPLAFMADGIYVHIEFAGTSPGLWLMDPDTGAMRQVLTNETVEAISDGAEWLGVVDPQDPGPMVNSFTMKLPDEIVRRDMATGQMQTWLYKPGENLEVQGVAAGKLLVSGSNAAGVSEYWIVSSPARADRLGSPEVGPPLWIPGLASDSHGLWFGSLDGVYLWTAHTGPVLVSDYGPSTVVGGCA